MSALGEEMPHLSLPYRWYRCKEAKQEVGNLAVGVYRAQEEKDYIAKKPPPYIAILILGDVGNNTVVQTKS